MNQTENLHLVTFEGADKFRVSQNQNSFNKNMEILDNEVGKLRGKTNAEIAQDVTAWLNENVSGGQTIAVDSSLTVEGAGADAKRVGQIVGKVTPVNVIWRNGTPANNSSVEYICMKYIVPTYGAKRMTFYCDIPINSGEKRYFFITTYSVDSGECYANYSNRVRIAELTSDKKVVSFYFSPADVGFVVCVGKVDGSGDVVAVNLSNTTPDNFSCILPPEKDTGVVSKFITNGYHSSESDKCVVAVEPGDKYWITVICDSEVSYDLWENPSAESEYSAQNIDGYYLQGQFAANTGRIECTAVARVCEVGISVSEQESKEITMLVETENSILSFPASWIKDSVDPTKAHKEFDIPVNEYHSADNDRAFISIPQGGKYYLTLIADQENLGTCHVWEYDASGSTWGDVGNIGFNSGRHEIVAQINVASIGLTVDSHNFASHVAFLVETPDSILKFPASWAEESGGASGGYVVKGYAQAANEYHSSTHDTVYVDINQGEKYWITVLSSADDRQFVLWENPNDEQYYDGGTYSCNSGRIEKTAHLNIHEIGISTTSESVATNIQYMVETSSSIFMFPVNWGDNDTSGGYITKEYKQEAGAYHSGSYDTVNINISQGEKYWVTVLSSADDRNFILWENPNDEQYVDAGTYSCNSGRIEVTAQIDIHEIGISTFSESVGTAIQYMVETKDSVFGYVSSWSGNGGSDGVENILGKIKTARRVHGSIHADPLTLLHLSDIHADASAFSRIMGEASDYSDVLDGIICTGDICANTYGSIAGWWDNRVMTCIGNHDTASYSDGTGYNWTYLTMAQRDEYYITPFKSGWGITHTTGQSFYYKDYSDSKVRLIVMDIMIYSESSQTNATLQNNWLESLLASAITNGLHVLIAIHGFHGGSTPLDCSFGMYGQTTAPTYNDCNVPQSVVDIVATKIANGLKFVGYICGHNHQDDIWDCEGDGKQLMYCVTCASSEKVQWEMSDQARGIGMDAYNVITIDTNRGFIKIIRGGGANIDDCMREREQICVDYLHGTIISE